MTLRERTTGTLERLMTMPLAKLHLLLGYGTAFAAVAVIQALITVGVAFGFLGLHTAVSWLSWVMLFDLSPAARMVIVALP